MRMDDATTTYSAFHDDGLPPDDDDLYGEWEDEMRINWCILFARTGAICLLVGVIVLLALGAIKPRLIVLAGICLAVLIVCLLSSFLDCCKKRFSTTYISRFSFTSPDDPTLNRYGEVTSTPSKGGALLAGASPCLTSSSPFPSRQMHFNREGQGGVGGGVSVAINQS